MMIGDPRECWLCGTLHVGKCARVYGVPTREAMETRMNAFLLRYAETCIDMEKARRVFSMMTTTRGMYT